MLLDVYQVGLLNGKKCDKVMNLSGDRDRFMLGKHNENLSISVKDNNKILLKSLVLFGAFFFLNKKIDLSN
ncbi:conserved hypothetical protein [Capnocytophaga canimorsus]|nr:conserved hypothetical protein [Capnocytophaga canimorsus]